MVNHITLQEYSVLSWYYPSSPQEAAHGDAGNSYWCGVVCLYACLSVSHLTQQWALQKLLSKCCDFRYVCSVSCCGSPVPLFIWIFFVPSSSSSSILCPIAYIVCCYRCSVVCVCVCLWLGHTDELCTNRWPGRDAVRDMEIRWLVGQHTQSYSAEVAQGDVSLSCHNCSSSLWFILVLWPAGMHFERYVTCLILRCCDACVCRMLRQFDQSSNGVYHKWCNAHLFVVGSPEYSGIHVDTLVPVSYTHLTLPTNREV